MLSVYRYEKDEIQQRNVDDIARTCMRDTQVRITCVFVLNITKLISCQPCVFL